MVVKLSHSSDQGGLINKVQHGPFAAAACDGCHQPPDASGKVGLIMSGNDLCFSCHPDFQSILAEKVVHSPAQAECATCHDPHAASQELMVRRKVPELCSSCHLDLDESFAMSSVHPPFGQGRCFDCHEKHSGDHSGLLKESKRGLCLGCHQHLAERFKTETLHSPVKAGRCGECHDSHARDNEFMLLAPRQEICLKCHNINTAGFRTRHSNYPMQGVNCVNCHDPHSTTNTSASLLYPEKHPPFGEKQCLACHKSGNSVETKASGKGLCLMCHAEKIDEFKRPVVHLPVNQEAGCLSCHSPHTAYTKTLLNAPPKRFCFKCHDQDEFTRKQSHPPVVEDCFACHVAHASEDPGLLTTADVMVLCGQCHADADTTHYHPMGSGVTDPRTGEMLVCTGCHEPHCSDYEPLVIQEKTRRLCIQCHKM